MPIIKKIQKTLSMGNRLAGCDYVCVAKIASFFQDRYLVVFACKTFFHYLASCIFKHPAKKVLFKGVYLAKLYKNLARSFKEMHPL